MLCDFTLSLLTRAGTWATKRNAANTLDRGDAGSTKERKESVKRIGIRLEWRSPPWLVQGPNRNDDEHYETLHWGTLLDGAREAWLEDVRKENMTLQMAVAQQIPHCKVYRRE